MIEDVKVPKTPKEYAVENSAYVISEIYVGKGDYVYQDQSLFDVETENVILEVISSSAGKVQTVDIKRGMSVESENVAMRIDTSFAEPFNKKLYRKINLEFLSGLMLGALITYVVLKIA
ncbi:biotin/lipoyl-containing protein [Glaciecola sp. MF2-115]|uniref:biotin/lipoyl-containing protein n=1 Tax=Glaciecola sp. MF2-115 TaxID=3384827 RepID=UPI0039A267AF